MPEIEVKEAVKEFQERFKDKDPRDILQFFLEKYAGRIAFSSSMGAEDQVITHMISEINMDIRIFTLDTGRLFPETYDLIDMTNKRYGINIEIFFPDADKVEKMVRSHGINLFYESVENRKLCCHIRKIEPLKKALHGMEAWMNGRRREQSITRNHLSVVEWDTAHEIIKVNPLLNWDTDKVWKYIHKYKIPYNPLHDKGYPSIGCFPCTRAIQPGEDLRAGRWWWENPEMKECGLHER